MPPKPRKIQYINFSGPQSRPHQAIRPTQLIRPTGPAYTARDRNAVAKIKSNLMREDPNLNSVQAGLRAVRQYDLIREVGLASSPSPPKHVQVTKKLNFSPLLLIKGSSPTRRPRMNGKLLSSFTKDDLVRILGSKGIPVLKTLTKAQIIAKVQHRAISPILKKKSDITRASKLLTIAKKYKSLKYRTKANIQNYANRHQIKNVHTKMLKANMISKIESKLNSDVRKILKNSNTNSVTMRIVTNKLVKEYGWHAAKNINRNRIQKLFEREFYKKT
jgi:hypothetical protein